jgi:hypothetical protein
MHQGMLPAAPPAPALAPDGREVIRLLGGGVKKSLHHPRARQGAQRPSRAL